MRPCSYVFDVGDRDEALHLFLHQCPAASPLLVQHICTEDELVTIEYVELRGIEA